MNNLLLLLLFFLILSCSKYNSDQVKADDDFVFSLRDTVGVRANSVSSITLHFSNKNEIKEGYKVQFESNKGEILQPEMPYKNNLAETRLKLAEDTGTYVIKAKLKEGDVVKVEKVITVSFPVAYNLDEYAFEVFDTTGARSDGVSVIGIRFSSTVQIKQGLRVLFSTNKGSLVQSDLPFFDKKAQAQLTAAKDTGVYIITAQLKDADAVKISKTIYFRIKTAYTHFIETELSSSTWHPSTSIEIKTILRRNLGVVTIGQSAHFRAFQLSNTGDTLDVGRLEGLLGNVSNDKGELGNVRLHLDTPGLDSTKVLRIQVKALNDNLDTIRRDIVLPYQ